MNGSLERFNRGFVPDAIHLIGTDLREGQKAIYCLTVNGRVVYVGSTQRPRERYTQHHCKGGILAGRDFTMFILRWCPSDRAEDIEAQVIKSYWRKGLASLNTSFPFRRPQKPYTEPKHRILSIGGKSQTLSQWARQSGMSRQTLFERLKRGWSTERSILTTVKY